MESVYRTMVKLAAALALIAVLLADILPSLFGSYADQRFLLVLLSGLLVLGSTILFLLYRQARPIKVLHSALPLLLFCALFIVLASPFSGQPYLWVEPGMYAFYFLAIGLTGVALSFFYHSLSVAKFFVLIAGVGCFFYGAMSINVYLFMLLDRVTDLDSYLPWGFVNIRYWGHVATWLLPLVPLAVLVGPWKDNRLWRILVATGAGLWWWIVFLSAARGSALGISFGVLLAALLLGRRALPWIKYFVLYVVLGIVFWCILSFVIPSLFSDGVQLRSVSEADSGRIPLFVEAWKMSLQNFPVGMGPQSWLTHNPFTEAYRSARKLGHPHNMYLMWAAEYGWLLLLGLALWVVQGVRLFFQRRRELLVKGDSERVWLLAGFTASVSAALFHAGISAVFMAPGSMLVGMFVFAIFWSLIQPRALALPAVAKVESPARPLSVTLCLMVASLILAFWMVWAEEVWAYYEDMRQDEVYYKSHNVGRTLPRFWLHGNFPR